MNIGDVVDRLTVSQSTIQEFSSDYGLSEFKVKSTDIFSDDLVKYFAEEIQIGRAHV